MKTGLLTEARVVLRSKASGYMLNSHEITNHEIINHVTITLFGVSILLLMKADSALKLCFTELRDYRKNSKKRCIMDELSFTVMILKTHNRR